MRVLVWFGFWVVTLGALEIDVTYSDGLHIKFKNVWKEAYRWLRRKTMTGVELIAAERRRQVEEEGWGATHDRTHRYGELAVAAAELAVDQTDFWVTDSIADGAELSPRDLWGLVAKHGYRGTAPDQVRALTIAGALIAAEIDRVSAQATEET